MKQELVVNALALTGRSFDEVMEVVPDGGGYDFTSDFSIEKFCYYLLSPEFIEKYNDTIIGKGLHLHMWQVVGYFGSSIYEYQLGNEQPLIDLLSKI